MNDDDFKQIVVDYINMVTTQRHEEIMAQGSEILAKLAALDDAVGKTHESLDTMRANFEKALAGASETIPAGHAQVLDSFVAPIDKLQAGLDDAQKKIATLEGETVARIEVIPVPGAERSPGIAPTVASNPQ